jgi:hypothetical protein
MKTYPNSPVSLADVQQLTYFRIYKTHPSEQHGTIALFSNGNQQCPMKVGLVAADAVGNPITLTQAEVEKALGLIHYDSGAALGDRGDGYTTSFVKNRFTWTESAIPVRERHETEPVRDATTEALRAPHDLPPVDAQTYTVYVSASVNAQGLAVAAQFNVNSTLFFTTNSSVDDPNGQGQDGQFNSSVEVLLAAPPFLSATDFGAASNGVVAGRKVGNSDFFFWATEYYLDPKLNGRALPLLSVGASASTTDAFGFYTHGDFFSTVQWGISYYSQPGSAVAEASGLPKGPLYAVDVAAQRSSATGNGGASTVTTSIHSDGDVDRVTTTVHFGGRGLAHGEFGAPRISYRPPSMYSDCVGSIQGANPNRVVIGILKGNLAGQFKDISGGIVTDVASTTMHILDAYGNDHSLSLSYDAYADAFTIA